MHVGHVYVSANQLLLNGSLDNRWQQQQIVPCMLEGAKLLDTLIMDVLQLSGVSVPA